MSSDNTWDDITSINGNIFCLYAKVAGLEINIIHLICREHKKVNRAKEQVKPVTLRGLHS